MELLCKKTVLIAVLAVSLLTSCKKNDNPPGSTPTRVKSASDDDGSISYIYDTKWRLIRYDSRSKADTNVNEYTYTDTTVKVKNYYGKGIYLGTTIYWLNWQGLAETMVDSSIAAIHTYNYNSNKQLLQLHISRTTAGVFYEWDYKYFYNSNGDIDSTTAFAKSNGLTTVTRYPQYDLAHPTTIGNENIGLPFLDASGKHPLKITMTADGSVLFNSTYTYDSIGRVATQQTKIGDVPYISYTFTYY